MLQSGSFSSSEEVGGGLFPRIIKNISQRQHDERYEIIDMPQHQRQHAQQRKDYHNQGTQGGLPAFKVLVEVIYSRVFGLEYIIIDPFPFVLAQFQ